MDFKKVPVVIYSFIITLIFIIFYQYKRRNKENKNYYRLVIYSILIFILFFLLLSYGIHNKNYFKNVKINKMKGGGGTVTGETIVKEVLEKPKIEIDSNMPDF